MGREVYPVEMQVVSSSKFSPDWEWEELSAEIDALPAERIGFKESIKLATKMARLLKNVDY